ncbi:MAG: hypothetical protein HGB33_06005 [Syntrophaceae bacterium]|nr:hypothetical protein [Syntrophaceae bacterium]
MANLSKKKIDFVAGLVMLLLLVPVFVSYGAEAEKEADKSKRPLRMAIIPFQAIMPQTEAGNTAESPLSGAVFFGGKIAKGGETVTEELFVEKLNEFKEIEIIPQEKVIGFYKRISAESLKVPLSGIIKKAGVELNADLVAVGYVFRYVERVGRDYGIEKAASVAFEISLVNSKDGSVVWRGVFDRTQKSLMEDLFQIASFYKGRGKWLTARELTKQGMNDVFKTFTGVVR